MKEGWEIKSLGKCIRLKSGIGLTAKKMNLFGKIPVYGGNGIIGTHDANNLLGSNIIIGRVGAKCGNVRHVNNTIWLTDNAFFVSDFLLDFDHAFLTYLLTYKQLGAYARQSAQPVISNSSIKDVELSFPKSLQEQQQIVSILDKAFAAINQAKANVERNLQNAKELFQSKLNEIFSQKGDGWVKKKLGEVCTLQRGFDLPRRLRQEGGFPLVSSSGISDKHNESKVKAPGVVTGRSGSIGKIFYIEKDFWPLNTVLYIKEFHGNYERFIFYLLKYFDLEKYASGTGVPTLNRNFVHREFVNIPRSVSNQKQIVDILDNLSEQVNQLTDLFDGKKHKLEELKKSILQKAFAGELTNIKE